MKIIKDLLSGNTYPYNRKDNKPVVGLDNNLVILEVNEEAKPASREGYSLRKADPIDDLEAQTRTIGWVFEELPTPQPEARWVEFGVALAGTPIIEQWFKSLPSINSILAQMIGGGLLQAAQGDSRTFLAGWQQCLSAGLVSPELAAQVQSIAAAYDLPADFVYALDPK